MQETEAGVTCGRRATTRSLWTALDLHAYHHFTAAAAVDGSLTEHTDGLRLRRSLTFGVYEGPDRAWGGALPPDLDVPDAEMYAVYAYMQSRAVAAPPHTQRLLVLSDCLGVLDAIESAWRGGSPTPLLRRDRGALLEAICRLRARFDRVVFLYVPSHTGIAPNAYADAVAKAYLFTPWIHTDMAQIHQGVESRPCLYQFPSDYTDAGYLRQYEQPATFNRTNRSRLYIALA